MNLLEFLKDGKGKYSATRLAFIFWSLGLFLVWAVISIKEMKIVQISYENIAFVGMLMSGKVIQAFSKKESE